MVEGAELAAVPVVLGSSRAPIMGSPPESVYTGAVLVPVLVEFCGTSTLVIVSVMESLGPV